MCGFEKLTGYPNPSKDQHGLFQNFFMGLQHSEKNKVKVVGFSISKNSLLIKNVLYCESSRIPYYCLRKSLTIIK